MKINYALLDPTGNITILATTPVPVSRQPLAAAALMEQEPSCEQVGFVQFDPADSAGRYACARHLSLRMAGGEFCGNASMAAAAYLDMLLADSEDSSHCSEETGNYILSVSGCNDPVPVSIFNRDDLAPASLFGRDDPAPASIFGRGGTVTMPLPVSIEEVSLPLIGEEDRHIQLPFVKMPGISHLIVTESVSMDKDLAEACIRPWCRLLCADGLGIMLLRDAGTDAGQSDERPGHDGKNSDRILSLTPLVYIPGSDTLFWENSCASGTAAAGYYLAYRIMQSADNALSLLAFSGNKKSHLSLSFKEPGGILSASLSAPDEHLLLSGSVRLVKEGECEFAIDFS